jgi:hypothetical protein
MCFVVSARHWRRAVEKIVPDRPATVNLAGDGRDIAAAAMWQSANPAGFSPPA